MIGQYRYSDKSMIEQDQYFEEISGANGYRSNEGSEGGFLFSLIHHSRFIFIHNLYIMLNLFMFVSI